MTPRPDAEAEFEKAARQSQHDAIAVPKHLRSRADHKDNLAEHAPDGERTRNHMGDEKRGAENQSANALKCHRELVAEKAALLENERDCIEMRGIDACGNKSIAERGQKRQKLWRPVSDNTAS